VNRFHFHFCSLVACLGLVGILALGPATVPVAAQELAYVTGIGPSGEGGAFIIDTTKSAVASPFISTTIPFVGAPTFVAITPDGAYAWVVENYGDCLAVISTFTNSVVAFVPAESGVPCGAFPAPSYPEGIAINPVADASGRIYAYVANARSASVSVIDTTAALSDPTNAVVSTVRLPSGAQPFGVAVTPDGKQVRVTDPELSSMYVIDTVLAVSSPLSAVTTVDLHIGSDAVQVLGVAMSPDGTTSWVAGGDSGDSRCSIAGTVAPFTTAQPWIFEVVYAQCQSTPGTLRAVAVAPTGTAYVAGDGSLGQVGYCGSTGCGFIPVGKNPFGIAITSDGSGAYVTNHDDDTVSVINTALNITVGTPIFLGSGSFPYGIAIQGPMTVLPGTGIAPMTGVPLNFTVIGAKGPNGSLVGSVMWDFFGNGKVVQKSSTLTTQFAYSAPGTYNPKVTVLSKTSGVLLTKTVPVRIQSPAEAILTADTLVKLLRSLNSAEEANLINTLKSALQAFNAGNRTAAFNDIGTFMKKVNALVQTGQLPEQTAAPVLRQGKAIQMSLTH
jgi:YVTN family beta-propeller protein